MDGILFGGSMPRSHTVYMVRGRTMSPRQAIDGASGEEIILSRPDESQKKPIGET